MRAPGKLFIAGEYAVVNPGYPAVLMAVNRFVEVTIKESETEHGSLVSSQNNYLTYNLVRNGNSLEILEKNHPFELVLEIISVTETYFIELNLKLKQIDIHIESQLDNEDKIKYGLGSSAAVSIALIRELFAFYGLQQDDLIIYKLASVAHLNLKSNGSLGDLAVSSFTGLIHYELFDRDWVLAEKEKTSLKMLVKKAWPKLVIEKLPTFLDLQFVVGWTKSPASTKEMVKDILQQVDPLKYRAFLEASKHVVYDLIGAIINNQSEVILNAIHSNRLLLKELHPAIETEKLSELIEIGNTFGASKSSGAGGGDNGLVFVRKDFDKQSLLEAWDAIGVSSLDLQLYEREDENDQ